MLILFEAEITVKGFTEKKKEEKSPTSVTFSFVDWHLLFNLTGTNLFAIYYLKWAVNHCSYFDLDFFFFVPFDKYLLILLVLSNQCYSNVHQLSI